MTVTTKRVRWSELATVEQAALLARPEQSQSAELQQRVEDIVRRVREQGDAAVLSYTRQFDCNDVEELALTPEQLAAAAAKLDAATTAAIDQAYTTIRRFHEAQQPQDVVVETIAGVNCQLRFHPLDAVGLYVPGGTAVLPSTALMLGIPAQIAGCDRVVLVTPPNQQGQISPAIAYAARKCGITEVYRCGGAQAIAALAYGTESIAKVAKIFGPGNAYVTAAKQRVAQDAGGAAIDMPAGPSELMVIADDTANAAYVAADLLSQAEHGTDSQVLLVCTSAVKINEVEAELARQLAELPRAEITAKALENSALIEVENLDVAVQISQSYAPEHLSVQTDNATALAPRLTHVGSLFLGHHTPESGGDYATGTNHVLPTYGCARNYSALGLLDFYRRSTVQMATATGLANLAESIVQLAETEGLRAHANAVSVRLTGAKL